MSELSAVAKRAHLFTLSTSFNLLGGTCPPPLCPTPRPFGVGAVLRGGLSVSPSRPINCSFSLHQMPYEVSTCADDGRRIKLKGLNQEPDGLRESDGDQHWHKPAE
jgi:hypothetical protein